MGKLANEMDSDEREFGSGWLSGMMSVVLAVVGLATVLCLLYFGLLTVASVHDDADVLAGLRRISAVCLYLFCLLAIGVRSFQHSL